LNAREYATLVPLVVLAFWIGIYPKPLFTILEQPVRQIVQQVNPGYYSATGAAAVRPPVVSSQGPGQSQSVLASPGSSASIVAAAAPVAKR
jgi:hypothetical protein